MTKTTHGKPAPRAHQEKARELRDARGAYGAAAELGMNRDTLLRVIAGEGVRPGTLALLRERFGAAPAESEAAPAGNDS